MAKLSDILKRYKGDLNRVYVDSCVELSNRVKEATPVDTGRARQSWSSNGNPLLGTTYRFTNNLEYIVPLEYGHSPQAPGGMLRINVRNWNSIVRANV